MIEQLGWGRGEASIAHTINALAIGFLSPIMALSINRFGVKKTMISGLAVMIVGLVLLGTIPLQLWIWIVLWGLIVPIGLSFGGLFPIQTTIMHWFNIRRATVLGIVMTGAALAGFIAQPTFTWLIQSTKSWQTGWLAESGLVLLALIFAFFIVDKPEKLGQHTDGLSPEEADASMETSHKAARTYRTSQTWTFKEILRTPAFWFIAGIGLVHIMPVFLIITHGVLHFTDQGYSKMQAATILSFVILGSSTARFPMGWLGDRFEPRLISTLAYLLMLLTFIGIWRAPNLAVLIVTGFLFGISYGTLLVMMPSLLGNYFGPSNYASLMGVLGPLITICGAIIPVGGGIIADKTGSYDLAFIIISLIIVFGIISAFLSKPPQKT